MIRTKQITVVCASVALLCILCVQAFAARSASPNYATNSHEDMSLYYYGYVQCRPSYNDDGKHARAYKAIAGKVVEYADGKSERTIISNINRLSVTSLKEDV